MYEHGYIVYDELIEILIRGMTNINFYVPVKLKY